MTKREQNKYDEMIAANVLLTKKVFAPFWSKLKQHLRKIFILEIIFIENSQNLKC